MNEYHKQSGSIVALQSRGLLIPHQHYPLSTIHYPLPAAMKVFLPGASGFVGERVLADLSSAGHTVTALTHSERSRTELHAEYPQAKVIAGDVASAEDMHRAMPDGTDAVLYLPGLLREFPSRGITFRRVHIEGVRSTLAAARKAGVKRWIQLSALGTMPNAQTEYFRTKYEAEELVRQSGLAWTVLRPSLIFDDRPRWQHNFVGELAAAIRRAPCVPILGSGNYLLQPVSLDDVSKVILRSLSKAETIGEIYELGGPETLTYREVMLRIARAMGTKKPPIPIPIPAITFAARLLGRFRWFPISADEIAMLRAGNYVHNPTKNATEFFDLPMKSFSVEAIRNTLRIEG